MGLIFMVVMTDSNSPKCSPPYQKLHQRQFSPVSFDKSTYIYFMGRTMQKGRSLAEGWQIFISHFALTFLSTLMT